jgi:Ca2+-binding RTX toxin-like protein
LKKMTRKRGTAGNDRLTGSAYDDQIEGAGGNDVINGKNGDDHILGGAGNDRLHGNNGDDHLEGGSGNDLLFGDNGNDKLQGGAGRDQLMGGNGNDDLDGGAGNDVLSGGAGVDELDGSDGTDTLSGGAGNDEVAGGADADLLTGGAGADEFKYDDASDSGVGVGVRDIITDFEAGVDDIGLRTLDANPATATDDSFTFLATEGAAFTNVAGQLRFDIDTVNNWTLVEGDTNGDGVADFQIQLNGQITLTHDDFNL